MIINSEKIRFRREMHRRIREVVAERRQARRGSVDADAEPAGVGADPTGQDDGSLPSG